MNNKFVKLSLLIITVFGCLSFEIANGWFIAGSAPKSYEMGIDRDAGNNSKTAATIRSIDKKIKGFGTLMQECLPGKYLGKRIKMTGFVKSENVSSWAGLWLRVDQKGSNQPLAFDNMSDRPIIGSTPWTRYEIVLDVPANACLLAYGALLDKTGQIWFDNITFEIVSDEIPTTGSAIKLNANALIEPANLDFEK